MIKYLQRTDRSQRIVQQWSQRRHALQDFALVGQQQAILDEIQEVTKKINILCKKIELLRQQPRRIFPSHPGAIIPIMVHDHGGNGKACAHSGNRLEGSRRCPSQSHSCETNEEIKEDTFRQLHVLAEAELADPNFRNMGKTLLHEIPRMAHVDPYQVVKNGLLLIKSWVVSIIGFKRTESDWSVYRRTQGPEQSIVTTPMRNGQHVGPCCPETKKPLSGEPIRVLVLRYDYIEAADVNSVVPAIHHQNFEANTCGKFGIIYWCNKLMRFGAKISNIPFIHERLLVYTDGSLRPVHCVRRVGAGAVIYHDSVEVFARSLGLGSRAEVHKKLKFFKCFLIILPKSAPFEEKSM
ncbi:hypothetical protein B0H13DRAFT_1863666 [Mycena leptocephala]|nr:hypothetical protein B0H13DRAFT_1863666 [Mycena leptocephala]